VKNRETRESFSADRGVTGDTGRIGKLDYEFLSRGINVKFHPLGIFIVPPLCVTREELDMGLSAIDEILTEFVDGWVEA
jgi:adenosylmethionine-8-amino-7-oxononanoate aminotransferase